MKLSAVPMLLLALLLGEAPSAAKGAPPSDSMPVDIGINVGGVNDYAVQSFFVDAMRQSRHWGSPDTPWDEGAAVDAQGWPTQDAGVVVLCCVAGPAGRTELAGTYSLSFQGSATVAFVAYPGTVANMQYDAATNTSTASLVLPDSGAGTSLMLSFTGTRRSADAAPGSGVTQVSIIRPQRSPGGQAWWTSASQVFTTPYLALLRPFSTLRFMDFSSTNNSPVTGWSQRTTLQSATQQSPNGAAWEYAILLANTLHKDIWINIPDQADNDYVTQLATLMHAQLDPSLHIWLEYSNEVWNFEFQQAGRNQAAAEAIVAADPKSPLAYACADYDACRYQWGERLIGLKAVQDGAIFRSIFGSRSAAIRPVYATQLGQTYFVDLVIAMIAAKIGPPSQSLYAIAQAPYWTGDNSIDGLTASQEIANASTNIATLAGPERGFAVRAKEWGLRSVTYEGGPGMSGTASLDAKIAANRSNAIGPLVEYSLRQAAGNGIGLTMYYDDAGAYGQYGMWGTTQSVFARKTPKLQAISNVRADKTEPLATGFALPASIAGAATDICFGSEFTVQDQSYLYLNAGARCGYLVNVPATGTYAVTLSLGNYGSATTGSLLVDRRHAADFIVPDTGGDLQNWTPATTSITLSAGLHVLAVKAAGAGFGMTSLEVGQ